MQLSDKEGFCRQTRTGAAGLCGLHSACVIHTELLQYVISHLISDDIVSTAWGCYQPRFYALPWFVCGSCFALTLY
jgi:hypothetical protein